MLPSLLSDETEKLGVPLIGCGLAVVLLAQWQVGVPVATAFILIGWGASLGLGTRPQGGLLGLINLSVYALLVGLAIAVQTQNALQGNSGQLSILLLIDHALAIVLLAGLTRQMVHRLLKNPT